MLSSQEIIQLIQSLIWLLSGVGVFIVGMNFMSDALEKSAGSGMKRLLEKISNNRISGVGIGAGVTVVEKLNVKLGYNIGMLNRYTGEQISNNYKYKMHTGVFYAGIGFSF